MRPTIEPPEEVAIEMSDLEKETYAWMGISPLVKLGRELNNPKTAIVSIVPIGSLPPEPEIPVSLPTPVAAPEQLDLDLQDAPTANLQTELAIPVITESQSLPPSDDFDRSAPPPVESPQSETSETAEELATPASVAEEIPEHRRRKRRSSATVD